MAIHFSSVQFEAVRATVELSAVEHVGADDGDQAEQKEDDTGDQDDASHQRALDGKKGERGAMGAALAPPPMGPY